MNDRSLLLLWANRPFLSTAKISRFFLLGLLFAFLATKATAQIPPTGTNLFSTNRFELSISPTNNAILVGESTNSIFLTISNYAIFSNITVTGMFWTNTNVVFLDNGQAPDVDETNGVFTGRITTPELKNPTDMTLQLAITGIDPNGTNDLGEVTNVVVRTNITVTYFIINRPQNNYFTNAFKIPGTGGTVTGTNNLATLERREPGHAGVGTVAASVWWKWPSVVSGNVLIDTSGSSFDSVLGVYTGSNLTNLVMVGSATNDVGNHLRAHLNIEAVAGETYYIAVSGYTTNEVGDVFLRAVPGAQPDILGPKAAITSPGSESLFTTNIVTFTGTSKDAEPFGIGVKEVFLRINNLPPTNAVGTANWSITLSLPPGTNIVRAFARDYAGNVGPSSSIVVRYINPINDLFADAVELSGIGGVVNANIERGSRERGEPFHSGNAGGHSIWYKFRPPTSGDLYLTTETSTLDTLLALYTGDSVSNLTEIASNDDAFTDSGYSALLARVVAGQLYYIAVDGLGGSVGDVNLAYSFTTSASFFSLFVEPPLGGTVSPPNDLYPANTLVYLNAIPDRNYEFVTWLDLAGDFSSTENPLPLLMTQNYSLVARFRVRTFTDTFRSGDLRGLPWSSRGDSPWFVVSTGGQFVARSGPITDRQSSSLILITNLFAGTGSFDLSVSSESGFDWFEFYLNGSLLNRWSGEVAWRNFLFAVPAGTNIMEWRYVKDNNFPKGLDAVFIDNLYLPLQRPNDLRTNITLSIVRTNGTAQLTVQGQANVSYVIQASSDLLRWDSISTNSSISTAIRFTDLDSPRHLARFYRVIER